MSRKEQTGWGGAGHSASHGMKESIKDGEGASTLGRADWAEELSSGRSTCSVPGPPHPAVICPQVTLHELLHALGFSGQLFKKWRDCPSGPSGKWEELGQAFPRCQQEGITSPPPTPPFQFCSPLPKHSLPHIAFFLFCAQLERTVLQGNK